MFEPGKQIFHLRDSTQHVEVFLISAQLGVRCADVLQGALPELGEASDGVPHLSSCNGPDGKPFAYMLTRQLWNLVRNDLKAGEDELFLKSGAVVSEPLEDFVKFMDSWDFSYEYSPTVKCPCCGNATDDWRTDPLHPFVLANANIAGLLVFHCTKCGATIRQKHFKDHVAFEFTPSHPSR